MLEVFQSSWCVCGCVSPSGCDDHCVACQGPGRCLECQAPYAVLQGQCVRRCGRNYFLDAASRHCKRKSQFGKLEASGALFKVLIQSGEDLLQQICIIWLSVIQTAAATEPKMSVSRVTVVIASADGRSGQTPVIAAPLLPNNFLP